MEDHSFKENAIEALNEMMTAYPDDCILATGSLAFAAYIKQNIK